MALSQADVTASLSTPDPTYSTWVTKKGRSLFVANFLLFYTLIFAQIAHLTLELVSILRAGCGYYSIVHAILAARQRPNIYATNPRALIIVLTVSYHCYCTLTAVLTN
jgi:hypothetical protein